MDDEILEATARLQMMTNEFDFEALRKSVNASDALTVTQKAAVNDLLQK